MGDDKRRGIFNDAPNQGTQNYFEGPQQRLAPSDLATAIPGPKSSITVQVRIYGQDHEMQTFGRDLAARFSEAGIEVILFDGDSGTRYLKGVVVEPAPNSASRSFGSTIASALAAKGISVSLGDGPDVWSDKAFVRVGVGANV